MPRVFLIEQDPSLREWCRMHLGTAGFTVVTFDDGRRALEALRGEPPALVVIATNLGGLGAFALAAAIRSNVRSALVPLLFLVPARDAAAMSQALAIEPEGVLGKPFTRDLLIESVRARVGTPLAAGAAGGAGRRGDGGPSRGTASGPLLETKQATVLAVVVRNFVSLARSLNAGVLDRLLAEFAIHARQSIFDAGGWIVRTDAMSLVALFEEVPNHGDSHAARGLDAALGAVYATRLAKRWAESALPSGLTGELSIGCGIHTGEVIVARLTVGGHLVPTIAGPTADLAQRLEGRAKSLHWSVACSEESMQQAGRRFAAGQRATLTDTEHGTTVPVVELLGYAPGAARPGELARMGEVREAVLANTMLASLAGDVDREVADRTIMVRATRPALVDMPRIPGRRVERRLRQTPAVDTVLAVHAETGRREVVKVVRLLPATTTFVDAWQAEYRKLADHEQRNIVTLHEAGRDAYVAYVALEHVDGGTLAEALERQLPVGVALNCLAQACMALDGLQALGIVHGDLKPEHFAFREDGSLVLVDINASARVGAAPAGRPTAAARSDFLALGRILHALLTGDRYLLVDGAALAGRELELASRLSVQLQPIQPILDGLLGVGGQIPVEQAPDVLMALLTVRELFPFDMRAAPVAGIGGARQGR